MHEGFGTDSCPPERSTTRHKKKSKTHEFPDIDSEAPEHQAEEAILQNNPKVRQSRVVGGHSAANQSNMSDTHENETTEENDEPAKSE